MAVDSLIGRTVAGLLVNRQIGRGAMGSVYLAVAADGAQVALKLLAPQLAHDDRFRRRFLRESGLAATLEHPNIVRTVASGEDDGRLYLALEYVDGPDLRDVLRRERRLEPARAVDVVSQVAAALDAAHAAGLVHRDVKPGNVLIAIEGGREHAYVCDFGLARHVSSVGSLTGDRGFVGTVDYVAPEQIAGEPVDGRADGYALGCVLYECLTGRRPFERDSELAVVFAHLNEEPPRVTEARPELPAAFDGVVARALAKSPRERYPTCAALAAAAADALHGRVAPRRSRGRALAAGVAAMLVAAAVGIAALVAGRGDEEPVQRPEPGVLSVVDPDGGAVLASVREPVARGFAGAASDVVVAGGAAWLLFPAQQRLLRVDARTHAVTRRVRLPWRPLGRLAVARDWVWAGQEGGPEIARVPLAGGPIERFPVGDAPTIGLAAGGGTVWVASEGNIEKVIPANGGAGSRIPYEGSGRIAWAAGALLSLEADGVVRRLDPATGRDRARTRLDGLVADVAGGDGLVWAAIAPGRIVHGLDPRTLQVRRTLGAGVDPERLAFAAGRLWVTDTASHEVRSLDPRTGDHRELDVGAPPAAAAYGNGTVWAATVAPPSPLPAADGPELRLSLPDDYLTLDPAASHSDVDEQLQTATCANLLSYPDAGGAAGGRLRPEVAAAMPTVSGDGRTWTFVIRPGFRFSPPSNEPVTAATFKHTLERAFSPKSAEGGRGPSSAPAIAGLPAFAAGRAAHISGIRARGDTLSVTLVRPSGDLPTRLSLAHLCPVPLSVPIARRPPGRPLPSNGPYYVASHSPSRLVLLRNPGYAGQRPRHWARIVYSIGVPTSVAVALVDRGELDYLPQEYGNESPLVPGGVLDRRDGPHSDAPRSARPRYVLASSPFLDYIVLNAGRPLFADVRRRRAVNIGIDRPALALAYRDLPGDSIVPPPVPGFAAGASYPVGGPDLALARRLLGNVRHRAVILYCTYFPFGDFDLGRIAGIVRAQLARIGIDASIVSTPQCAGRYDSGARRADLLLVTNFGSEIRDPASFLGPALEPGAYGAAMGPGPWATPAFRRRLDGAGALRGTARTEAYRRLERELMHAAPFVVYGTFSGGQYLSPRVGCRAANPASDLLDLVALCPRPA
jgi:ABC-type transport system substrate-binding protein/predicted Ser/Thr protein kinase